MEFTVQHNDVKMSLDTEADDFAEKITELIQRVEDQTLKRAGVDPSEADLSSGSSGSGSSDIYGQALNSDGEDDLSDGEDDLGSDVYGDALR